MLFHLIFQITCIVRIVNTFNNFNQQPEWNPSLAFRSTSHMFPDVNELSGMPGLAPDAKNRMCLGR